MLPDKLFIAMKFYLHKKMKGKKYMDFTRQTTEINKVIKQKDTDNIPKMRNRKVPLGWKKISVKISNNVFKLNKKLIELTEVEKEFPDKNEVKRTFSKILRSYEKIVVYINIIIAELIATTEKDKSVIANSVIQIVMLINKIDLLYEENEELIVNFSDDERYQKLVNGNRNLTIICFRYVKSVKRL